MEFNNATVSNSTSIGCNSIALSANMIVLGTINETTIFLGKLNLASNYSLTYTTLPSFSTSQVGYINPITKTSNTTFVTWDSILNLSSLNLAVGVYLLQYTSNIALTSATIGAIDKGWNSTGFSTTTADISICENKFYFYKSNISYYSVCTSYYYTCTTATTTYFNSQMISNDNSGSASKFFYLKSINF